MQRCVYAIPSSPLQRTEEMMSLERDVQESRISSEDLFKKLQVSYYFVDLWHKIRSYFILCFALLIF